MIVKQFADIESGISTLIMPSTLNYYTNLLLCSMYLHALFKNWSIQKGVLFQDKEIL